ncbi:MAG: hypothetical protein ACP5JJ_13585 [Anaerolineae bacterium]
MRSERDIKSEHRADAAAAPSVPRFVADALAWMEVQRAGLERLRVCQLEDVGDATVDAKGAPAL